MLLLKEVVRSFGFSLDDAEIWINSQHPQPFYSPLSGTAGVSRNKKKHSPTHHPGHSIFISFFHLPWSIASFLFKLRAWQLFCTASLHVLFDMIWEDKPVRQMFSHMENGRWASVCVCVRDDDSGSVSSEWRCCVCLRADWELSGTRLQACTTASRSRFATMEFSNVSTERATLNKFGLTSCRMFHVAFYYWVHFDARLTVTHGPL